MTLDNVLKEVEPIFQSSNFTHPSFQEILAARQFAEEINSGRLSVMAAYHKMSSSFGPIPNIRPVIYHMVDLLSKEKALELVELVSHVTVFFHKSDRKFNRSFVGLWDRIAGDLVVCAKFIGKHEWDDSEASSRARDIIDMLGRVYYECAPKLSSDEFGPIHKLYQHVFHGLNKAKSTYANKHFNARLYALVTSGAMFASSPDRIREFSRSTVSNLGVDRALEVLLEGLCMFTDGMTQEYAPGYLRTIFEVIKGVDFEKKYVGQFNNELSRWQNDGKFKELYRSALQAFAQDFKKDTGSGLYDALEKTGVQFFDSGAYKPK